MTFMGTAPGGRAFSIVIAPPASALRDGHLDRRPATVCGCEGAAQFFRNVAACLGQRIEKALPLCAPSAGRASAAETAAFCSLACASALR